jgi:hypothetical protein
MVQCCCRVMLATVMSSHTGISAAKVTWPRRDVDAEVMSSHAGDGTAES